MEYRNELHEIFVKHGTDKAFHGYDIPYFLLFEPLRHAPIRLCEIGVLNGCSLRAWEEYFPNATIHAIDIDPEQRRYSSDRTTVFVADQGSHRDLQKFITTSGGCWDIVIDDGGHCMNQQQHSLDVLYPHVVPGGFYVVEDVETSWHPAYNPDSRKTTASLIVDEIIESFQKNTNESRRGVMVWPDIAIFAKPKM